MDKNRKTQQQQKFPIANKRWCLQLVGWDDEEKQKLSPHVPFVKD